MMSRMFSPIGTTSPAGNRRFRPRRAGLVLSLVAILGAVTACGSSSKSNASSNTSSAATAAGSTGTTGGGAATGAPIKVGMICSCSGAFGTTVAPTSEVYRAWTNTVNASGGINGHPIVLDFKDDAANPGTSVTDVKALIADHNVAIVDWSLVDDTWASVVQASNIPVVGGNLSDVPFYNNPDFYPEGQTNDSITASTIATAKQAGIKNLGVFACVEAASCTQGASLAKTDGQKQGLTVNFQTSISATAPSYTAQCVAAQQAKITGLLVLDSGPEVAKVGSSCSQQGYNPTYVTEGEGFGPALLSSPGVKDDLWSPYNAIPYWADTPATKAMNAAVDKYYPGLEKNTSEWIELGSFGWPSGLLLEDAVKAGGLTPSATPTSAEIVQGLESLKGDTLQGMAPPLTFPAGKTHSVDCWFTAHVKGGTPSLVDNGKLTCGSPSS